jgi:peptidoglycan-associated lipoprotein
MKTKLTLAVGLLAVLGLAGCATSSKTDAPAPGGPSTAPAPGAATGTAPKQDAAKAEVSTSDADQLPVDWRVHFAFDSNALDDGNRKVIEDHARYLVKNPSVKVQLEGHTDERGTREYNLALGERRAQAVEKMLRVLGVAGNRVSMTSFGEEKPAAPEHNEEGWALNRRVEIIYQ